MFGKKQAKQDPEQGGWMKGKKAKRLARRGQWGDDKVFDRKGNLRGDFRGRKMRQQNEHGV